MRLLEAMYWRSVPTSMLYRDAMFCPSDGEPMNAAAYELCRRLREQQQGADRG